VTTCVGCSWAVFQLINPNHSFQRSAITKAITFPYKTTALTGKLPASTFVICQPCITVCCWREGHLACKKTEWWDAGVVMCLDQGADLHIAKLCHCHSLSFAPVNADWFYLPGFTFLVPAHPTQNPRRL